LFTLITPILVRGEGMEHDSQPLRQIAMARVVNQQSAENMAYVRRLLWEKQPGFSAALELALAVAELELWPPQMPAEILS
jgi:hypothetical protein